MDTTVPYHWLPGALRDCGRPALALLVESYMYLPRDMRDGVWRALVMEISPTDPRERLLRDAASAVDSVGAQHIHRAAAALERARVAWEAEVAT